MYKIPLAEIKEKILASGKINSDDFEEKIKNKINELSGLVSEEGAAHIIANELGIVLINQEQGKLKIKEIYAGMRNVSTVGKVVRKFETREFAKGDSTGKVCSMVIGDETSTMRVVFWNDKVDLTEDINQDDIIKIDNAYVKENNNSKELHLNDRSEVEVNPEGEKIENVRQGNSFERKSIESLQDNSDNVELLGTVVQVFDPRFFNICPRCNKRANEIDGKFNCSEHGEVEAALSYVLNLVIDDGTGNIRGVFWKNQVNHLLDKTEEEISVYKDDLSKFEDLKTDLLGEQFRVMGRVRKNEMFDRLEFNVQVVEKAKAEDELAKLESNK
jgi:ssDNA-binding replication factor A large subunit